MLRKSAGSALRGRVTVYLVFTSLLLVLVSALGRLIAVGLMICGLGLIGSVTATVASWFVEQIQKADQEEEEKGREPA